MMFISETSETSLPGLYYKPNIWRQDISSTRRRRRRRRPTNYSNHPGSASASKAISSKIYVYRTVFNNIVSCLYERDGAEYCTYTYVRTAIVNYCSIGPCWSFLWKQELTVCIDHVLVCGCTCRALPQINEGWWKSYPRMNAFIWHNKFQTENPDLKTWDRGNVGKIISVSIFGHNRYSAGYRYVYMQHHIVV